MNGTASSPLDVVDYSVAIPSYGQPDRLRRTLEHVLAQRWPTEMRWEVFVNDDGSDPPLETTLASFKDRVRFGRNTVRQGWPQNWNKTLEKARGTWIHMLHHDDIVDPEFAPTVWNLTKVYPQAVYIHSALKTGAARRSLAGRIYFWLRPRGATLMESAEPRLYRGGVEAARHALTQGVRIPTIVVRREIAVRTPGMRAELLSPSDEEYVVRLAQQGDVVYCPQAMCTYIYHTGQCSLQAWLAPSFLAEYQAVHDEAIRALGAEATEADRKAAYRRIANAACNVARARALAGQRRDALAALTEAVRFAPEIEETAVYKRTTLIVRHAAARLAYRCLFG
jgi:hypothetical protein